MVGRAPRTDNYDRSVSNAARARRRSSGNCGPEGGHPSPRSGSCRLHHCPTPGDKGPVSDPKGRGLQRCDVLALQFNFPNGPDDRFRRAAARGEGPGLDADVSQTELGRIECPVVARLVWKSEMAHSSGYWELANPKPAAGQGGHRRNAPWESISGRVMTGPSWVGSG